MVLQKQSLAAFCSSLNTPGDHTIIITTQSESESIQIELEIRREANALIKITSGITHSYPLPAFDAFDL
jgi:hypothetical protein